MNWNISAWSIRNPVPVIVLFIILTVAGLQAFFGLGVDETPNIDVPVVAVTVSEAGASPDEMETQVTRKVENAVAGIGNIKHIVSIVNLGVSTTSIEFELGTNTDRAVNDVREAISRIRQQLPEGIYEPVIQRLEFIGGPVAIYSLSSDRHSAKDLSWLIDNDIARSVMLVPGVGQVLRYGGVDREIRVNLDPNRLDALGVTADAVNAQLRALNINLPGGRGEVGAGEQAVRTLGSASSLEALRQTKIALPNGHWASLGDLGTCVDGSSDIRECAYLNGQPTVAFALVRSSGSNMVDVEDAADKKIAEIKKTLPPGVSMSKVYSAGKYVRNSYEASLDSLVVGAALAVFVIWLFLKDVRAAVISALAMPLSVVPTFYYMKLSGYTMNNMSLLGLALVIGILVDDAIVEIENIVRHIAKGKKPYPAAIEAADEIGMAVIATTFTIVAVFIPVAFMGGIPGQFFKQFGLTVAAAVMFSLVVARMLTPLLAAYFLTANHKVDAQSKLATIYSKMLDWALAHRRITVGLAVAFFALGIVLFQLVPTSLIGKVDKGETQLSVELPPGSTMEETKACVDQASKIVQARPEVASVFATVGGAAANFSEGGSGEVNQASLYITLKPRAQRNVSEQEFESAVRPELKLIAGARTQFKNSFGMGGTLKVLLVSQNADSLNQTADALVDQMRTISGLADIRSSAALVRPEILVVPDMARAADQGVSVRSIARTAQIATLGDMDSNLAKFDLSDRQINIRVQLDPAYRKDAQTIGNLKVISADGHAVPLKAVAKVEYGAGPFQIDRFQRARQVTIEANLLGDLPLGVARKKVHELPAFVSMPKDVREELSGDAEIQHDVFAGFGNAIGSAILLIYAVLVLLFGGFLQPLTIMMSLPLALGGALMALVFSGQSLGMYALIGIVMLMGLVTKNAILLVEYCLGEMKKGVDRMQAIKDAGNTRMRPILMTTIAMICGMLPIAIGLGAGAEARAPMALAVIGGLITSTVLTLLVVPVVFTYIDDLQNWIKRKAKIKPVDKGEDMSPQLVASSRSRE
jgi:hydrophobe/amphiphile efflux-1 (HAE1) family protein